jgi:transcriptional regulator with XRE-family HTH domain
MDLWSSISYSSYACAGKVPQGFMDYADQRSQAKSAARPRRRRNEHDVFYAGERLGIARRLTGMSQQRPADHLGVSFQAVQKYESGQNRLSAGRLVAARQVPDVGLAYFAKDKPRTEASPRASAPTRSTSSRSTACSRRGTPRPLRQPVPTIARVAGSGGSVDARGVSVDARSAAGGRETANDRRHCHR